MTAPGMEGLRENWWGQGRRVAGWSEDWKTAVSMAEKNARIYHTRWAVLSIEDEHVFIVAPAGSLREEDTECLTMIA